MYRVIKRGTWRQLTMFAFLCAICGLISMQANLTKTYKKHEIDVLKSIHGNELLQSELRVEKWDYTMKDDRSNSDEGAIDMTAIESAKEDYPLESRNIVETPAQITNLHDRDVWGGSDLKTATSTQNEKNENEVEENQPFSGPITIAEEPRNAVKTSFHDGSQEQIVADEDRCPEYPAGLVGNLKVDASLTPSEDESIAVAGDLLVDGCYEPAACVPRQTVAIIIPYKNRKQHLITLMHHLHPVLQRQAIRYCVFVAEQFDNGSFNKARVMNAAFSEVTAKHRFKFDCVIFHDVDMLLENDKNLYVCGDMPTHLSPAIDKFNYSLNYGTKFGGVTAIKVEHYKKVNGHGNDFWGWGGEDNDMEKRIARSNLTIKVVNETYGKYKMIPHDHPWWFSPLYGVGSYLKSKKHWSVRTVDNSGLSDLRYNLRSTSYHKLWTKLTIDIRTVLVEKAVVRFYGYDVGTLEFISPSQKTEDGGGNANVNTATSMFKAKNCKYERFTGKTVNKTLGIKQRTTYGRMYNTLQKAQTKCNELGTYCNAIVEEHLDQFSLRYTAFMHENYLKYRSGIMRQVEVIETHKTHSVHVKICQGDSSYLNFFIEPIVLAGDLQGPSPAYYVEFKIRIFYEVGKTLYYESDIMSSHKATIQEKIDAGILESELWDTMGNVYSSRIKLLNLSDAESVQKVLPADFRTVSQLLADSDGIITVKTPLVGILRNPGCYVCRSALVDETGTVLIQWRWWFELRAKTAEIENDMLDKQLEKARLTSLDFTKSVEKRREMLINYHRKMRDRVPIKGQA